MAFTSQITSRPDSEKTPIAASPDISRCLVGGGGKTKFRGSAGDDVAKERFGDYLDEVDRPPRAGIDGADVDCALSGSCQRAALSAA
jgi:hypothetical protein